MGVCSRVIINLSSSFKCAIIRKTFGIPFIIKNIVIMISFNYTILILCLIVTGLRPTFEQMQVLVARNKARPLIPQLWKQSNPAIKQLRETIEDCWDNDAEARLSAMCIERRLWELPKLWSRYKGKQIPRLVTLVFFFLKFIRASL